MLAMRFPYWMTLPWIPRRVLLVVAIAILVPAFVLLSAKYASRDMSQADTLQVAALVLAEDMSISPLKTGWALQDIHITDDMRLEMDVNVAYYYQAEFIKSRNGRVRYSYLKLNCPAPAAEVFQVLPKNSTVWVRLLYNNELIVAGGCPTSASGIMAK